MRGVVTTVAVHAAAATSGSGVPGWVLVLAVGGGALAGLALAGLVLACAGLARSSRPSKIVSAPEAERLIAEARARYAAAGTALGRRSR